MDTLSDAFEVVAPGQGVVASIRLNGYNIASGSGFGELGALRSFKLETGSIDKFWSRQTVLTLQNKQGTSLPVRIALLPVDSDGAGFVEFVATP